ncbi:MAG: alpha-galactosidase [Anaerohalosphaeraceae bacterium]
MNISRMAVLFFAVAIPGLLYAVEVNKEEMAEAGQFVAARFGEQGAADPVFAFVYDGRQSKDFLKGWTFKSETISLDENRKQTVLTYTDPATKLEVRCVAVQWHNFPVVEWTVYVKNKSEVRSPMIEHLRAINTTISHPAAEPVTLHHIRGDDCSPSSYAVRQSDVAAGSNMKFAPAGGRPSSVEWPYYNFKMGDKGFLMAIGWPGQWSAEFSRDEAGLRLNIGQEQTHFVLEAGEVVRTPLMAMMFYQGDWIRGQNLWRQWMIRCNFPKDHGMPLRLPLFAGCSSHFYEEMAKADEQSQFTFIDGYLKHGLKLDYWWMDAGWYTGAYEKGWHAAAGTWEIDRRPHRFPNGLRPISDYAHSKGIDIIVWFEPERVMGGTWLAENHSEWLLGALLNLGNPEAWNWLVNHIDKMITDEGIDLYRQDFNIDPLGHWRGNDAPDRQGITENKYVAGYLAYWDELLRRHPGMLIDSCASGGRRNDLETMRRAIPLYRSDYILEPVGNQGQTYGLSLWLPFYGAGYNLPVPLTEYCRRSTMCPANVSLFDIRAQLDDKLVMKLHREWLDIAPHYFGDYYPLTSYNIDETDWIAWQFNRPDVKSGNICAFRRSKCYFRSAEFKLHDLDPKARYRIDNADTDQIMIKTGAELMEKGLVVEIPEQPGAVILKYAIVNTK